MERTEQPPAAPAQQLNATVLPRPDGSVRMIFCAVPSGQYVGEVSAQCANPALLLALADGFRNWAASQRPGVQPVGADALGPLERAMARHVNGGGH